jgi:small ligand-binding sensory domain FIST
MKLFPYGHATHPQWQFAAALVLAQLRAQMAQPSYASSPTLAILYITDHYSSQAQEILDFLSAELPEVTDWSGTVGVGIASNNVEYFDEPALCVMLCDVPAHQYRVFSGVAPLAALEDPEDELLKELPPPAFQAHTALIHADGNMPDAAEMIAELSQRIRTGYLFGGFAASRSQSVQFAVGGNGNINGQGAASGVFAGGLSGVAFSDEVLLLSRVSQGCQPLTANGSKTREITACDGNLVIELDGEPALDVLLRDLNVSLEQPQEALEAVRATLVGLTNPKNNDNQVVSHPGIFGSDVRVRHIIGLDPAKRGVAVAQVVETGMNLAFCQRNVAAARSDLVRICAEIREELESQSQPEEMLGAAWGDNAGLAELADRSFQYGQAEHGGLPPKRIAGAIYVSCSGRGGPHFGGPSAELQIVRKALGDVPLVGFFAGGEIARHHVYGYTGVLTVFMAD